MKRYAGKIISATLAAAMLWSIPSVSFARLQKSNAAFVYNFESDDDFTKNYVTATGGNTVSFSDDGFGGSQGAMKVDVVNGGTTIVSLGDMNKGYYKMSAYVKPVNFTSALDKFTFVLTGTDFTATRIISDNVGLTSDKWVKVEANYLLTSDITEGKIYLRLGDANGNFTNTVGSTSGLTTYSYMIDDITVEKAAFENSTIVYKESFDATQTFTDVGMNKTGTTLAFEKTGGYDGGYAKLTGGTAIKFNNTNGFDMKPNRIYKATVWAKADDDAAVGKTLEFFEDRVNSQGQTITVKEKNGKTLTKDWQLFEFDGIRHFATSSKNAQTKNFASPTGIQLKLGASANISIDEFTISEYPIYYNGDFEKNELSDLSLPTGYQRVTEGDNSYIKVSGDTAPSQIISYPYMEPGASYQLKYKIRIDNVPRVKNTADNTYENSDQAVYAGITFAFNAENYESQYLNVQEKVYDNQADLGKWKEVTQTFIAPSPKADVTDEESGATTTYTAYTPMAHFRVSPTSIGKIGSTRVDYSIDDIEIIPYNVPSISELTEEGNLRIGETVTFKWTNDIEAGSYIYKIYQSSDDGWANVAMGTLTAQQTSVDYTVPQTAGGKQLKFELTAVPSNGRSVKASMETQEVAAGDISSVIEFTNTADDEWLSVQKLEGKVTVANSSTFPGSLIATLYNGDVLENVVLPEVTKDTDGSYKFSISIGNDTDMVKVMHWDGFDKLIPYAEAKEVQYTE